MSRVAVEVSDDHMEAWIRFSMGRADRPPSAKKVEAASEEGTAALEEIKAAPEEATVTPEEVKAALETEGIVINDYVAERIEALGTSIDDATEEPGRFPIAKGQPPVEGKDGEFTWHESLERIRQDWQGDAPINYYTLNSIVTAEKDQPIGTITRARPGTNGFDVYGKTLKPDYKPSEVQLDQSVRLADDGSLTVFSNPAGKVIYADLKLSIDEVITIRGDVDFESGNIDSTVHVDVQGCIRDLFSVESAKSITVVGVIEAANLRASDDVVVCGGILGRAKGTVEAEGEIVAKFCVEADLRAKGDIKIVKEVMNSRIRCESKLLIGHGSIIGGEVYACEGVEAAVLGSEANVRTSITVGIHPDVLRQVAPINAELKTKREASERVHQTLTPLLAELRRLTPTQKKQATELLMKVRTLVTEIQEAQAKRDEIIQAGRAIGVPYVYASYMVRQGVSIRIGRRHTIFHDGMKGPVKIEKRKVDNVTEFVAVNELSGSITVLPSAEVVEKTLAETPQSEG